MGYKKQKLPKLALRPSESSPQLPAATLAASPQYPKVLKPRPQQVPARPKAMRSAKSQRPSAAFILAALPASPLIFNDTEASQLPFKLISDQVQVPRLLKASHAQLLKNLPQSLHLLCGIQRMSSLFPLWKLQHPQEECNKKALQGGMFRSTALWHHRRLTSIGFCEGAAHICGDCSTHNVTGHHPPHRHHQDAVAGMLLSAGFPGAKACRVSSTRL